MSNKSTSSISYLSLSTSTNHACNFPVFAWYLDQGIKPTPLNPRVPTISVSGKEFQTTASPSALDDGASTSLSVITPPAVTRALLKEAKEAGIRSVWLQPGSYDDDLLEEAKRLWPGAAVGGFEGLKGYNRHEGWCVLVHGEDAGVGKKGGKL